MSDLVDRQLPALAVRPAFGAVVPAIVADARAAYMNAVADFLAFAPVAALGSLAEVRPIHVSAYIEHISARVAPQTVKQRLAALRALFDWLARPPDLAAPAPTEHTARAPDLPGKVSASGANRLAVSPQKSGNRPETATYATETTGIPACKSPLAAVPGARESLQLVVKAK